MAWSKSNPRKGGRRQAVVASPLLKICGLRQPEQAAAVAALGVDAIGVIGVARSPRFVEPSARPALWQQVAQANPRCRGVLVVCDPEDSALEQLQADQGHRVVQLHGDESPQRCRQLREQLPGLSLWKALRIRTPAELEQAHSYSDCVDALLLDAWVAGQGGGTGQRLPLAWLTTFEPALPWWLAGGIRAATAAEALAQLSPHGLDASSGVERSPGDKDLQQVQELLAVVRLARQDRGHSSRPVLP